MEVKREKLFLKIYKPFGIPVHKIYLVYHVLATSFLLLSAYHRFPKLSMGPIMFQLAYGYLGGLGITVGCHRYWTHKTFKANLPLQILLMIFQTISGQFTIHKWCLDHRIHHKFTDTDADPYNSRRGFWFSHMGWLCSPKTKELREKLKSFDMPDLESDPVVRFQSRWFGLLFPLFFFVIPVSTVYYVWGLSLVDSLLYNVVRGMVSDHITYCVNSVAHIWGDRHYDRSASAADNKWVSFFAVGEGWHNYHHTFPWDYRSSEFGWKYNLSTVFIDFFAKIGWAWELKTVSPELVERRIKRTGITASEKSTEIITHKRDVNVGKGLFEKELGNEGYWGWDDESMPDDFRRDTKIL